MDAELKLKLKCLDEILCREMLSHMTSLGAGDLNIVNRLPVNHWANIYRPTTIHLLAIYSFQLT